MSGAAVGILAVGVTAFLVGQVKKPSPATTASTTGFRAMSDYINDGYVARSLVEPAATPSPAGSPVAENKNVRLPGGTTSPTKQTFRIAVTSQSALTGDNQVTAALAGQSYTAALARYGTYHIQLNNCASLPPHQTYANGSWVMLDNRSAGPMVLSYNGRQYSIGRYGYQVIRLASDTVPYAIKIDCWNGNYWANNAAQITLQ